MRSLSSRFEGLADRESFNASVRHIKTVVGIIDRVSAKENLADIVNEMIEDKILDKGDVLPIVSMVLGSKFKYRAVSSNLFSCCQDLQDVSAEAAAWNGVDLVVVYHHPDVGPVIVNPKNPASMARIDRLSRSELVVAWAGCFAKEGDADTLEAAAEAVVDLFSGKKVKAKASFLKGECSYRVPRSQAAKAEKKAPVAKAAPKKATAAPKGKASKAAPAVVEEAAPELKPAVQAERAVKPGSRMTPMYSVTVTNELFHNGNVEAWKRIIASYTAKFKDLQVLVYYDGEKIVDINSLFKWGKVKHGSSIQFAVAGDEIQGVAKLQRYLAQGASPQFEAFLRGPVNAVLPLF